MWGLKDDASDAARTKAPSESSSQIAPAYTATSAPASARCNTLARAGMVVAGAVCSFPAGVARMSPSRSAPNTFEPEWVAVGATYAKNGVDEATAADANNVACSVTHSRLCEKAMPAAMFSIYSLEQVRVSAEKIRERGSG